MRAMNTVIAAQVKVARWRSIASRVTPGSKRYMRTIGIGTSSATPMCPIRPVMWKSGATASTTSSSPRPIQSRNDCELKTTFACVFIAPFGEPVVPEV